MNPPVALQLEPLNIAPAIAVSSRAAELEAEARRWLAGGWWIFDASGTLVAQTPRQPQGDTALLGELARTLLARAAVAYAPAAECLAEEAPLLLVALPVPELELVAVGAFASQPVDQNTSLESLAAAAHWLGLSPQQARGWFARQQAWPAQRLLMSCDLLLEKLSAESKADKLRQETEKLHEESVQLHAEIDTVSNNLSTTYEEISLLYGVTQKLRISNRHDELGQLAIDWLLEVVPATGIAIQYAPTGEQQDAATFQSRSRTTFLTAGECPLNNERLTALIKNLSPDKASGPTILNVHTTGCADWRFPEVRQLILLPLTEGENLFGWLAAFNHRTGGEFGTVEASLLGSIAAILGIHSGNLELYRQQADFLANVVRALTSAIDAKDPYTCGHSDRVARVAARLAQQMGLSAETVNTIYLSGLLHDIGKIGIDDNVLRKTGRLTEAEFEHIKLHPELGYKILVDLKQLQDVLPVVLHHHESWDGNGYPKKLAGEEIPLLARIVAVADAFDAMSSDRPYRKGMPDEKVDEIFRKGAGQQWDANVVEAFFSARNDIREIGGHEAASIPAEMQHWA